MCLVDVEEWYKFWIHFYVSYKNSTRKGLSPEAILSCCVRSLWDHQSIPRRLYIRGPITIYITVTWWDWWRLKSPASRLFTQQFVQAQIKKTSKLHFTGLCEGKSLATGEFPVHSTSNAESVFIRWRNYVENLQESLKIPFAQIIV